MTARNPAVRWRVAVTVVAVLVVYAAVAVTVDVTLRSWPFWALDLLDLFVLVVAIAVVVRWMQPWYRPAPRKPVWTEDMLP